MLSGLPQTTNCYCVQKVLLRSTLNISMVIS